MAGIGFVLRKLLNKDDLSGVIQAYLHATIASSGPWLFTVLALGSFFAITGSYVDFIVLENFRGILMYNFAFSLVITAPLSAVSTRYLADLIYKEDVEDAPAMLLGTLLFLTSLGVPLVTAFYLFFTNMGIQEALFAMINFMLIASIWQASIFISAIKQYTGVTFSFLLGMMLAVSGSVYFADSNTVDGMILGFNLGLAFIFSALVALIFAEYPRTCTHLFRVTPYFKKYWELALGGLFYSLAIWVDKWIFWLSPEALTLENGLLMYPPYDSAMFVAYLTVVPAMAMFLISQETAFFEEYVAYYQDIQNHANFDKIEKNHRSIIRCLSVSARKLMLFQGGITFLVLLTAPKILSLLGMNYIQLGMFRFGVLGAFFQVMALFITIVLSYFDNRKAVCALQGLLLVSNAAFTYATLQLGFPYYGYGYFLASLLTFTVAAIVTVRFVIKLPYSTFVLNNTSVYD